MVQMQLEMLVTPCYRLYIGNRATQLFRGTFSKLSLKMMLTGWRYACITIRHVKRNSGGCSCRIGIRLPADSQLVSSSPSCSSAMSTSQRTRMAMSVRQRHH